MFLTEQVSSYRNSSYKWIANNKNNLPNTGSGFTAFYSINLQINFLHWYSTFLHSLRRYTSFSPLILWFRLIYFIKLYKHLMGFMFQSGFKSEFLQSLPNTLTILPQWTHSASGCFRMHFLKSRQFLKNPHSLAELKFKACSLHIQNALIFTSSSICSLPSLVLKLNNTIK